MAAARRPGEELPLRQDAIARRGHAVEARLYAEDPERGFLPSTGRLLRFQMPAPAPGVRVDSGFEAGDEVSVHYDPMLAKIIVWAADREAAFTALRTALEMTDVEGVRTNARFLWEIAGHPRVRAGQVDTRLLERELKPDGGVPADELRDAWLLAAVASVHAGPDSVDPPVTSAWDTRDGFRLNQRATIRVPLRMGADEHWLRVERQGGAFRVHLDGSRIASLWRNTWTGGSRPASTVGRSRQSSSGWRVGCASAAGAVASNSKRIRVAIHTLPPNTRGTCAHPCRGTCSTCARRVVRASPAAPCWSCSRR